MKLSNIMTAAILFVAGGSLLFRLPALTKRPMHADEAVQAARFEQLWLGSGYRYDPDEFHGPTLSYATLPAVWLSRPASFAETSESTFRVVPVFFGSALILALILLGDGLGKASAVVAAVFFAISPAMVFYSRYYIHEMLLVFFSCATLAAAWRYARTGQVAWCLAAGAGLGLMQATKETAILSYAAAGLATLAVVLHNRRSHTPAETRFYFRPVHLLAGCTVAVIVTVLLQSSFGDNPRGPWDGILTYLPWLQRAGGASPHIHPWYFYLHRLTAWQVSDGPWWSESLILFLAIIAAATAWARPQALPNEACPSLVRWLSVFAIALVVIYSGISYKTPWCLLQFLWSLILLAGVGVTILWQQGRTWWSRLGLTLTMLVLSGHLGWQAYRASFVLPADPRNPYVYAQSLDDVQRLARDVDQLAAAQTDGRPLRATVLWKDPYYWPLPWYLRRHEQVGFATQMPVDIHVPLVIASPEYDRQLSAMLEETHLMTGYYGIRPGVLAEAWVSLNLWEAHLRRLGRLP